MFIYYPSFKVLIFRLIKVYLGTLRMNQFFFSKSSGPPRPSVDPHPYRATYARALVNLLVFIKTLKNDDQLYTYLMKLKLNTRKRADSNLWLQKINASLSCWNKSPSPPPPPPALSEKANGLSLI